MRIHFDNLTRPKLVAKSLRKTLNGFGARISLSRCHEAVAAMYGYANWHELTKLHAALPASPDDADCPLEILSARRVQYGNALIRIGVTPELVGPVLDAVRPTDRSSTSGVTRLTELPRFLIEGYEVDEEGNEVRSLGMQDITWAVVSAMVPYDGSRVRNMEEAPTVYSLQSGLTEEARRVGFQGKLALTDFKAGLERFISRVGGKAVLPAFKRRLDEISWKRGEVRVAEEELATVRNARFSDDIGGQVMFYVPHDNREYVDSIGDAYDDWGWDEYIAINPRPDWDDTAGREHWNATYAAWQSTKAPPFVFGTKAVPWSGIDAAEMRRRFEEDEYVDLDGMIESSLEEHYDEAYDQVVAPSELYAICGAWMNYAGTGSEEDLALEGKIADWNGRQTIVTYFPDFSTILPRTPNVTHAEAIGWCERILEERKGDLRELSRWEPPEAANPGTTVVPAG